MIRGEGGNGTKWSQAPSKQYANRYMRLSRELKIDPDFLTISSGDVTERPSEVEESFQNLPDEQEKVFDEEFDDLLLYHYAFPSTEESSFKLSAERAGDSISPSRVVFSALCTSSSTFHYRFIKT